MENKSPLKIVFSKVFAILVLLVILVIANIVVIFAPNYIYESIVHFFNNNFVFLVVISLVFLFAELFSVFIFPFSLVYPIFNAIGGVLLASFLFDLLRMVFGYVGVYFNFELFRFPIYFVIVIVCLIVGYVKIFSRLFGKHKKQTSNEKIHQELGELRGEVRNVSKNLKDALKRIPRKMK